jgi:MFS transporter, ACS family, glucarate transporter
MDRLRVNPKYLKANPSPRAMQAPTGAVLMRVERKTHVRFFLAFWLFVLSAVAFLDRTNVSIAGLQISKEYALGNQRLGWIFSAFLIGYAVFQLPAGWLATRFGPRRVLPLGVLW